MKNLLANIVPFLSGKKNMISNLLGVFVAGSYGVSTVSDKISGWVSPEMTQTPEFQSLLGFLGGGSSTANMVIVGALVYTLWRADKPVNPPPLRIKKNGKDVYPDNI